MSTASASDDTSADLGLGQVLSLWWRQRARFALLALAGAAIVALLAAVVLAIRPARQETTLVFRLLFEGVDRGQYPTGKRFTPSDIVTTKVLQEVYRRNALERFIKFEDFKDALAVTARNPAIDRLRREYQGRLQDRRLTPADKKKLEEEYELQAKPLLGGQYTLVLDIPGSFARWPETLAGKVLDDTLAAWAEQSRDLGVFKFDLNTFSENILTEINPDTDDYPVLLDRLRVVIERVRENLNELARVPGARLVRVGERKVSLGELEAALNDDVKYRLSMIEAPVYTLNFSRNRTLSGAYIREQLFRLQRETQSVRSQIAAAKEGLADYSASRSGASSGGEGIAGGAGGDSFIDRMLDLSTRGSDVAFRQDLVNEMVRLGAREAALEDERSIYEKMQKSLAQNSAAAKERRAELEPWVQEQIRDMMTKLRRTLGEVALLHREISERNLQASMVYAVPDPVQQETVSRFTLGLVLKLSAAIWILFMGTTLVVQAWRGLGGGRE
jgi:hypothetical protein